MKIFISTKNNKIYTSTLNQPIRCFTEYGLSYKHINTYPITKTMQIGLNIDRMLLVPCTHITNIWHLMHHLFMTYKYNKNNNIKTVFLCFFPDFYERQRNIFNSTYIELMFTGMGFDIKKFKHIYKIFEEGKAVNVNKLFIVDTNINFNSEPLMDSFRNHILNNFNIVRETNKRITFILRRGTREITNLDFVKKELGPINYIYMEDHTIAEQLENISNTDILIGVHGAGLAWCVFMKKKSLLIELYPGNSNTDNYIRWCKIANIRYKRLCINISSGNSSNFRQATVHLDKETLGKIYKYFAI